MEHTHEIVELNAFEVIGLSLDCPGDDTSGIEALWQRLFGYFVDLSPQERIVGVSYSTPDGFRYVAGAEMPAGSPVPSGMQRDIVPAARWITLQFNDKPEKMQGVFTMIFDELIPKLGLQQAPAPICLEVYPEDCMDEEAGTLKADLFVQLM
jgi:predicted transcriptional regulator YdeE